MRTWDLCSCFSSAKVITNYKSGTIEVLIDGKFFKGMVKKFYTALECITWLTETTKTPWKLA